MNANSRTTAPIEMVPISQIYCGPRLRARVKKVSALSKSIEKRGLIHPIIIDGAGTLIVGGCRLAAATALGWKKIPARRFNKLTPEELLEIERDENVIRTDLDSFEQSKERMREILRINSADSKGGRGKKGGNRAAARELGIDEKEIRNTRKHVETAEEFPAFQRPGWKKAHVLDAREIIEKIPPKVRDTVVEMISERGVPPKTALCMLDNIATMPAKRRSETVKLYRSGVPEEMSLARTRAAAVPPPPDPRIAMLDQAHQSLMAAKKRKTDSHTSFIKDLAGEVAAVLGELREEYKQLKEREMS